MKQILVLFLMLLLATISYAGGVPNTDFKKFQIGINFSPDVDYRILKVKKDIIDRSDIIRDMNEREKTKLGFTGGINACYNFNHRMGLEAGIQYSNKGYQYRSDGTFPNDPLKVLSLSYNFQYIDIPLKANFTLGGRKIRFIGSAGLVTNLFIQERILRRLEYVDHTETNNSKSGWNDEYKKVNLSAMISAGISWQLNEKMSLRIEPTYRQGLTAISNEPITAYLYNVGLNFGCYYGF